VLSELGLSPALAALQVIEFEEWGNPKEKEYYHYMQSYSPVDNIKAAAYPNVLITAGLHDPRVGEGSCVFWARICSHGPLGGLRLISAFRQNILLV
jgi:protease II